MNGSSRVPVPPILRSMITADTAPPTTTGPDAERPRRWFRIRVLQHEPEPEPIWPVPLPRPAVEGSGSTGTLTIVPPPEPTASAPAPDPAARAADQADRRAIGETVGLILQVIGGRMPAPRLARLADPPVQRYVAAATHRPDLRRAVTPRRSPAAPDARTGPGDRVCSMRIDRPVDGVAEVAAVCRFGERFRAIAARFELRDARWTCVALRLG
ncbi:hypothetical protein TOK_4301 [Pseudonocardia sp. N23]|nr:hypothetical protein TOK_4301 [Pseudonocardia sp. N23]